MMYSVVSFRHFFIRCSGISGERAVPLMQLVNRIDITDVRAIVSDDYVLQEGLIPSLEEYNVEQFITVTVPGQEHQVSVVLTAP